MTQVVAESQTKRPPQWPQPFDRRLFRLAAERADTPKDGDWMEIRCLECREVAWTRDAKADLCEDCLWAIMNRLGESTVKQNQLMARQPYDPFQ